MRRVAAALGAFGIFALACLTPAVAAAQSVEDSAAVRARVEAYRRIWNTHDASTLAAFHTDDADLVMGNLPPRRGRSEIQDFWQDYFARQERERSLALEVSPVRFVTADVALVNVTTTTGGRDRQGHELEARKFRGTWLWRRDNDRWLIAAMRGLPHEGDHIELNASVEAAEALRPRIRAFVAAYEDAFNTHDPSAVSAFYTDDAEIVVRNSPVVRGPRAILDWWRAYFSQPRPSSLTPTAWYALMRTILIIDEIRLIAPEVALLNITATGAAERAETEPTPVRHARATWVVIREAGEWRISALWVLPSLEDRIVRGDARGES